MKRMSLALLFAAFAAFAAPASAGYLTGNGLVVEPRGDTFFVPYRGQSGARAFWCAAAEYAQKKLAQPPATRIYRTSKPPRRSGEGIGFSLSPGDAVGATGLVILGPSDGGLSIASALSLCDAELFLFR